MISRYRGASPYQDPRHILREPSQLNSWARSGYLMTIFTLRLYIAWRFTTRKLFTLTTSLRHVEVYPCMVSSRPHLLEERLAWDYRIDWFGNFVPSFRAFRAFFNFARLSFRYCWTVLRQAAGTDTELSFLSSWVHGEKLLLVVPPSRYSDWNNILFVLGTKNVQNYRLCTPVAYFAVISTAQSYSVVISRLEYWRIVMTPVVLQRE